MFYREVRMPNGLVYSTHKAMQIIHVKGPDTTDVMVESWISPDDAQPFLSTHTKPLDPTMNFEAAEEWLKTLPDFNDPVQDKLDTVLEILTDEQAETVPEAFPAWVPNTDYKAGDRRRYSDGYLYKCIQDHKSQEDWTPDATPALWTRIGEPGEIPVWVQPTGTQDAYNTGDKVHFPTIEDPVYESTIDGNVWSPADYPAGWAQA